MCDILGHVSIVNSRSILREHTISNREQGSFTEFKVNMVINKKTPHFNSESICIWWQNRLTIFKHQFVKFIIYKYRPSTIRLKLPVLKQKSLWLTYLQLGLSGVPLPADEQVCVVCAQQILFHCSKGWMRLKKKKKKPHSAAEGTFEPWPSLPLIKTLWVEMPKLFRDVCHN